jgi:hypothetical protein
MEIMSCRLTMRVGTSSILARLACTLLTIPRTDSDARLLALQNASVFQVVTQTLQEVDSHAVEDLFYLRIEPFDNHRIDVPQPLVFACFLGQPFVVATASHQREYLPFA